MKLNWFEKLMMNSPFRPIKQRNEAHQMLKLGGEVRGGRILEIGCGRGVGVEIIFDTFYPSYVEAFDFDPDQVGLAKVRLLSRYQDKVKLYDASATEIPSPDNSFDAVFDFGVLHHIPNNSLAIGEIARVLKPEAQFTWEELSLKLSKSGLVVSEKSCILGSNRVIGVARKHTISK